VDNVPGFTWHDFLNGEAGNIQFILPSGAWVGEPIIFNEGEFPQILPPPFCTAATHTGGVFAGGGRGGRRGFQIDDITLRDEDEERDFAAREVGA